MSQGEGGGRPLKFKTVDELVVKIEEYFNSCDSRMMKAVDKLGRPIEIPDPRPYTITGLAMALDTTRDVILDYESGKYDDSDKTIEENKKFSYTINKAKLKIHNYVEESLWTPKIATGIIFNLKNNWNWEDKQIIKHQDDNSEIALQKLKEMNDELSKEGLVENS